MFSLWYASLAHKQLFRWVIAVKWLFMKFYWCDVLWHVKPTSWCSLLSSRVRNVAESISAWHLAYEKDVVIQSWHTTHTHQWKRPLIWPHHTVSTRVFFVLNFFKITKPTGIYLNLLKPSVYFMYHWSWHSKILHSAHRVFICFVCVSEKKIHRRFPYTTFNEWLL
jgi:hypothetical protein